VGVLRLVEQALDEAGGVLAISINLIRMFSIAALPFIPDAAGRTLSAVGVDPTGVRWIEGDLEGELHRATPGSRIDDPGVLFAKVLPENVAAWSARFAGSERGKV